MKTRKITTKGWHSRGYLPHFDGSEITQFITIRLADSLPRKILNKWRVTLENHPKAEQEIRDLIEEYLDNGIGNAWLSEPSVADLLENALLYFDGDRFRLHSWVVMPNHAHILLTPITDNSISDIVHSIKSYTAKKANRVLDRRGRFWQADYYDRYIRNEEHHHETIEYIEMNPVKAGLCGKKTEWIFSSASKRFTSGRDARAPRKKTNNLSSRE